jgi:hypothetical protein
MENTKVPNRIDSLLAVESGAEIDWHGVVIEALLYSCSSAW